MKRTLLSLTNARLAAVQAIYQHTFSGLAFEEIMAQLKAEKWDFRHLLADDIELEEPDISLVEKIVTAYQDNTEQIDDMICRYLTHQELFLKMDETLKAILRAAFAEMQAQPHLDKAVIVSEYTDIARSFFDTQAVHLVNAVLDKTT